MAEMASETQRAQCREAVEVKQDEFRGAIPYAEGESSFLRVASMRHVPLASVRDNADARRLPRAGVAVRCNGKTFARAQVYEIAEMYRMRRTSYVATGGHSP